MPAQPDLRSRAAGFAALVTGILNKTVAKQPVNITAAVAPHDPAVVFVGNRVTPRRLVNRVPFPLRHRPGIPPLHMLVSGRLCMDYENRYLTVQSSVFAVSVSADGGRPLFHVDYERGKADGYPEAHLQVHGRSDDLKDYTTALGERRDLPKLHFPVGGRRFRPSIEDVIEFLAAERLVDPAPNWRNVIQTTRNDFHRMQLKAAIRRYPHIAREALAALEETEGRD